MVYNLSDKQISEGKDLYKEGYNYYYISQYYFEKYGINIHPESVRYYITRKDRPKITIQEKLSNDGIEKVLVLSDLHIPYHRGDIVDIVKKHKDEISTLVIGGDLIDCYCISSFGSLDPMPLVDEMAKTHNLLKRIQDITPNVKRYMVLGNHEERYKKYLEKNKSELNKLHSSNILKEIVCGFEKHDRQNGTVVKYEKLDYHVEDSWFMKLNDTIICHPISFSRVGAKTAQMALDYFVERGQYDFSNILVAHTHKISSVVKYGKYAYEIGCLCLPQSYAESGKLTYEKLQNGYFLATYKNGIFDPNESRQYYL